MFSNGARKKANRKIDAANKTMDTIQDINSTAQDDFTRANAMADTYNMAYQMNLNGGYDQANTIIGRNGLKIQYLNLGLLVLLNKLINNTYMKQYLL